MLISAMKERDGSRNKLFMAKNVDFYELTLNCEVNVVVSGTSKLRFSTAFPMDSAATDIHAC